MAAAQFCFVALRRKYDDGDLVTQILGDQMHACVSINELQTLPKFTCTFPGHYLVIWSGRTFRENLAVEVISPAVAAIARNSQEWKLREFDQVMSTSITLTRDGFNNITGASMSQVIQNREWMPFDYVSFPCQLYMDTDDVFELDATPAIDEREWDLYIFRLGNMPATEEMDNPNLLTGTTYRSSSNITRTLISPTGAWRQRYRVVCTGGTNEHVGYFVGGVASYDWRPGFNHTARARVWRNSALTSGWPTSNVTLNVIKNSTSLHTAALTLPADESVVEASYLVTGTTSGDFVYVQIEGIDNGESFEMELTLEPVL